ncbi:hypothetical protein [Umezawaea beigongshangensis]|uniref:hypothetical protein n=1 Tax=Umezawaea beigongshangensis TaxID=2780383 RepID=UPI0018F2545E|nr:hypothetical protein [Umezawaea beigongshangensis]
MTATVRRGANALPEIVLNTATDPARTASWLPSGVPGPVGDSRVEWDGGSLRVRSGGAGASEIELTVHDADEATARRVLDALVDEVEQNFNVG